MAELRVSEDIVPLSEFKARAAEWLRRVESSGSAVVITQNGRAAGVVLSPAAFDELSERARFVASVREGLGDAEQGHHIPHHSMVAEVRARYGDTDD